MAPKKATGKVAPAPSAATSPKSARRSFFGSSGPKAPKSSSPSDGKGKPSPWIPTKIPKVKRRTAFAIVGTVVLLGVLLGILGGLGLLTPKPRPLAPPAPPPPCLICEANTRVRVSLRGVSDLSAATPAALRAATAQAIGQDEADVKIDAIEYAPRAALTVAGVNATYFRARALMRFVAGASQELVVFPDDIVVESITDDSDSARRRSRSRSRSLLSASSPTTTVEFRVASITNPNRTSDVVARADAMTGNTNAVSKLRDELVNFTSTIATAPGGAARVDLDYVAKFEKPSAFDTGAYDAVEASARALEAAANDGSLLSKLAANGVTAAAVLGTQRLAPEPPDQDEIPEADLGPPPEFSVPLVSSGECLSSDAIIPGQKGMALKAAFEDEVWGYVGTKRTVRLVNACELDQLDRTDWNIKLYDDGTHGDPVARDGFYTNLCLKACPGENNAGFLKNRWEDGDFAAIGTTLYPLEGGGGAHQESVVIVSPRLRGAIPVENVGRGWGAGPNYVNATVATSHAFFVTLTDEAAADWPDIKLASGHKYFIDAWSLFGLRTVVKWSGDQFDYVGVDAGTNHEYMGGSYQRLKDWFSGLSTAYPRGHNIDYDGYLPQRLAGIYLGGNDISTDIHELAHGVFGLSLGDHPSHGVSYKYFGCQSGKCAAADVDAHDIKYLQEDNQHFAGRCTVHGQLQGGTRRFDTWGTDLIPTGETEPIAATIEASHDANGNLDHFEYVEIKRFGETGIRDANDTNGVYYAQRMMDSFQLYYAGLMSLQDALDADQTFHCMKAGMDGWDPADNGIEDGMNGRAGNHRWFKPPASKYTTFKVQDLVNRLGPRWPPAPYQNPFSRFANTVEAAHVVFSRRPFGEAERAYWTLLNRYAEDSGLEHYIPTQVADPLGINALKERMPRKWGFGSAQFPHFYTWKAASMDIGRKRTRIDRVPCGTDAAFRPISCFPDREAAEYPTLAPLTAAPPPPPANEWDIFQRGMARGVWLPSEMPRPTKQCTDRCLKNDFALDLPILATRDANSGGTCNIISTCGRGCLYGVQSADRAECDKLCVDYHRNRLNNQGLGEFDTVGRGGGNDWCGPKDVTHWTGCYLAASDCATDPATGQPFHRSKVNRQNACRSGCLFHHGLSDRERRCVEKCAAEGYPANVAHGVSCGGFMNCEQGCLWASEQGSKSRCKARCAAANDFDYNNNPITNPRQERCHPFDIERHPWRGEDYVTLMARSSPSGEELYRCNYDGVAGKFHDPNLCGNDAHPGKTLFEGKKNDPGHGRVFRYDDETAAAGFCDAGCDLFEYDDSVRDPCSPFSEYRPLWCYGSIKPGIALHST